jgi:hypothetical protein
MEESDAGARRALLLLLRVVAFSMQSPIAFWLMPAMPDGANVR